jgi:diadenosine tetraphosphate (Ap4A) HIT family hydrolase
MWLWLAGLAAAVPAGLFALFRAAVWWQNRRCVFCAIASGKLPVRHVEGFAHEWLMAFYDIWPMGAVHVLVVPREHRYTHIGEVSSRAVLLEMREAARQVLRLLQLEERETELSFVRRPFNTVFHLHLHVVHRPHSSALGRLRERLGLPRPALAIDAAIQRLTHE